MVWAVLLHNCALRKSSSRTSCETTCGVLTCRSPSSSKCSIFNVSGFRSSTRYTYPDNESWGGYTWVTSAHVPACPLFIRTAFSGPMNILQCCDQTWPGGASCQARVSCGKFGLLPSKSRPQRGFEPTMTVCLSVCPPYIFPTVELFCNPTWHTGAS